MCSATLKSRGFFKLRTAICTGDGDEDSRGYYIQVNDKSVVDTTILHSTHLSYSHGRAKGTKEIPVRVFDNVIEATTHSTSTDKTDDERGSHFAADTRMKGGRCAGIA